MNKAVNRPWRQDLLAVAVAFVPMTAVAFLLVTAYVALAVGVSVEQLLDILFIATRNALFVRI